MSTDKSTPILMPRPVPGIEGGIILMRPIQPDQDAEGYFQFSSDPELHRWTGNTVLPSVAAARQELQRLANDPHLSVWLIVDRITGELARRFFLCLHERQGQAAFLGDTEAKAFGTKFLAEDAVLLTVVLDDVLLLAVDEAGQSEQEEMPGVLEHEIRRPPPALPPDLQEGSSSVRGIAAVRGGIGERPRKAVPT